MEIIYAYTRKQAIADGVLVDVTQTAKEAGFSVPVALTHAVWAQYVKVPDGVTCQDEAGRLWDILALLGVVLREQGGGLFKELHYRLRVRNSNAPGTPPLVNLKGLCGYDDDGNPCLTVMLPHED